MMTADHPHPKGWDPSRTHTGMRAAGTRVVWVTCTNCGGGRAPHVPARNGEGLVPVACRHCHAGDPRFGGGA
jgi:hypothetical protein